MLVLFIVFSLLLIAGLYLGEIRLIEAGTYVVFLAGLFALCFAFRWPIFIFFIGALLVNVILILRIFKGDISLR